MLRNCKIIGHGISSDDYHCQAVENRGLRDFIMSPSSLKLFNVNPRKWIRGFVPKDSQSKFWGNLIDCLLLTPKQFDSRYAIIPATYESSGMKCPSCGSVTDSKKCSACKVERVPCKVTKDWNFNSDTCAEWLKAQSPKKCVTAATLSEARLAVQFLLEDETASDFIQCSDTQVHVRGEWHDKNGIIVPVQCLIDCAPDKDSTFQRALGDVKTTRNAEQEPFLWDAYRNGYHIQAAMDLDLHNAATRTNPDDKYSSEGRTDWNFIVQENVAPYEIGLRTLPEDFIQCGRLTYQHALERYARCIKSGVWPGYDEPGKFTLMQLHPKMEYEAMSQRLEHGFEEAIEEQIGDDLMATA